MLGNSVAPISITNTLAKLCYPGNCVIDLSLHVPHSARLYLQRALIQQAMSRRKLK